jgi:hypothetical protein
VRKAEVDNWTVELDPLPVEAWRAFGVAPRPSLILGIPVCHEWEQRKLPVVSTEPALETAATCRLEGRVVGPQDLPLVGASVELPSLGLSTSTGATGRFHFASIPRGKHFPSTLLVKAKGRSQHVALDGDPDGQTLIIRMNFDEG